MYRNDWEAAVARATALENELRQAQQSQVQDQQQIANLTAQLQAARAELARLQAQAQPMPGYGMYPPAGGGYMPMSFPYPNRGGTILVLGILSLVICGLLGPIAWSMGNEELRRIDAGQAPPDGRSNAQGGRICGMIASIFLIIGAVFIVFALIMASSASHHHY